MPKETSPNSGLFATATDLATRLMQRVGLSGKEGALDNEALLAEESAKDVETGILGKDKELDGDTLEELAKVSAENIAEGMLLEQVPLDKDFKTKMKEALLSVTSPVGEFFKNAWVSFKDAVTTIKGFVNSKLGLSEKIESIKEVCSNLWAQMKAFGKRMGQVIGDKAKASGQSIKAITKAVVKAPGKFTELVKSRIEARKNKGPGVEPARSK